MRVLTHTTPASLSCQPQVLIPLHPAHIQQEHELLFRVVFLDNLQRGRPQVEGRLQQVDVVPVADGDVHVARATPPRRAARESGRRRGRGGMVSSCGLSCWGDTKKTEWCGFGVVWQSHIYTMSASAASTSPPPTSPVPFLTTKETPHRAASQQLRCVSATSPLTQASRRWSIWLVRHAVQEGSAWST